MSLQGAIEWIQDQALTITGIEAAPDNPTELASWVNVFTVAYPESGEIGTNSANWGRDLDNIRVMILTIRPNLEEAFQRLEGHPHALARKIQADLTLGGNVTTYRDMSYRFVATDWSGVPVIGYYLDVNDVKALTTF